MKSNGDHTINVLAEKNKKSKVEPTDGGASKRNWCLLLVKDDHSPPLRRTNRSYSMRMIPRRVLIGLQKSSHLVICS